MRMITLETGQPWCVEKLKCKGCGTVHASVHPVGTPRVECPGCHGWIDLNFWTRQLEPFTEWSDN